MIDRTGISPFPPPAPPWYKIPLCFREKEGPYWPAS